MANYRPWTDDELRELRERHAAGASLRSIAKAIGRGDSSVHRKAKALGLSWDRSQTEAATRNHKTIAAERRARLEVKMLEQAERAVDALNEPCLVFAFGGKDNLYSEQLLDRPDPMSRLKLSQSATTLLQSALRIDAHVTAGSSDGVRSMLGQLGQALGLHQHETPETAE